MAAPRPDVKFYLDTIERDALKVFADHDGIGMGELTERVMSDYLQKRIHDATVLATALERAGITRDGNTESGAGRK